MVKVNAFSAVAPRALDSNADPVPGSGYYFFEDGTSTPVDTFTDETGATTNAHPVVSNGSAAFPPITIDPGTYRVDLRTPEGVSLPGYPMDGVMIGVVADGLTAYPTRSAMVTAAAAGTFSGFADGTIVAAGLDKYVYADGETVLSGLPNFLPAGGSVSFTHFGAVGDGTTDDKAAIDATMAWLRGQFDSALGIWPVKLDCHSLPYRCVGSIGWTEVTQSGSTLSNFQIYGERGAGSGIVLDLTGTVEVLLQNVQIVGDETDPPLVGIWAGRFFNGVNEPIASNHRYINVQTDGDFVHSAIVRLASEVHEQHACIWTNEYKSATTCGYMLIDSTDAYEQQHGAGSLPTSDFSTIPPVPSGSMSNIDHDLGMINIRMRHKVFLTITNISQANPVVVTVTTGTLAGSGLENGDEVYIQDPNGMDEIDNRTFTVANISGDTFELSGEDGTGHTAYVSGGFVRNRSGIPLVLSGAFSVVGHGYTLAYGNPALLIDMVNGVGVIRGLDLDIQHEPSGTHQIEIFHDSSQNILNEFKVTLQSHSQVILDHAVKLVEDGGTSTGSLRFRGDGELILMNQGPDPVGKKVFSNPEKVSLEDGFDLRVPISAMLHAASEYKDFSGRIGFDVEEVATDRDPAVVKYIAGNPQNKSVAFTPVFRDDAGTAGTATTAVGRKIYSGDMVEVLMSFIGLDKTGLATGSDIRLDGFGETCADAAGVLTAGTVLADGVAFTGSLVPTIEGGEAFVRLRSMATGAAPVITDTDDITNGNDLHVSLLFRHDNI